MTKPLSLNMLLIIMFSTCGLTARPPVVNAAQPEILWDTYGVPHIFAPTMERAFYGYGLAQMTSHGDLLLRLYGQARGRGAEYWGQKFVESDQWTWTMSIPSIAGKWFEDLYPEERVWLDAFVSGINHYAKTRPDEIADEVKCVLPVTANDVLAHSLRVIHFTFVTNPYQTKALAKRWQAGSNAWAIAPKRSESGHALLLANPHLPWRDLFRFYEAHIVTPDMNLYGAGLVGHNMIAIGFNDHLGWTHTVNTHDGADHYELTLSGEGYKWNSQISPFDVRTHEIQVKQDQGESTSIRFDVKHSVHGPVIAEKDGKAVALRVVGLNQPHMLSQYIAMGRAHNLTEFETAVRQLQNPMFTVMYADRDGHIMHLFGGRTPKRNGGDWKHWEGLVDGSSEENLWTQTHTYAELPKAIDPDSGWLQNANDPPWTTTFPSPLKPDHYPPYMAPKFMHFRAQHSSRLLATDDKISLKELVSYKHSTSMEMALRLLDDLEIAVEEHGDSQAKQAMKVLKKWDGRTDADSRGAVLFKVFANHFRKQGPGSFSTSWSHQQPTTTPDGFTDPQKAAKILSLSAAEINAAYGSLDVAWGDVHRFVGGDLNLPANGAPGSFGTFRVISYQQNGRGKFKAVGGDSFIAAIEFSSPPRARVLLGYGNATQPRSSHRHDQLKLMSEQRLRPAWRLRPEIEANLERRESF